MTKTMLHIIRLLILLLLGGALIGGVLWSRMRGGGDICSDVEVEIVNSESSSFVTGDSIKSELQRRGINPVGRRMRDINTDEIERKILQVPHVESLHHVHIWALSTEENALTALGVSDSTAYRRSLLT